MALTTGIAAAWAHGASLRRRFCLCGCRHTPCSAPALTMPEVVHILLVEDDSDTRRRAAGALERAGWSVAKVASPAACLTALERARGSVVLVNIGCRGNDGHELLARLAAEHPDTPVVILIGAEDLARAGDAIRGCTWDYVVKRPDGSHLADLPQVVARILERHRLTRERDRYRAEAEALATALRGTAEGIVILDPMGRILFTNAALLAAWRRSESDVLGCLLGDFVAPPGGETDLGDVFETVAEQKRWSGELRARGVEPSEGAWDATLTAIPSPRALLGAGAGRSAIVGVFREVSEKHLEQLHLDFVSMITHDIKVPLTVILGYTEMLTDPEPPPDQIPRDALTRIRESGERIHALVCNLLDLSRIEAGVLTLDPRPFDLCTMLTHALDHHGASARRKGVALELAGPQLPPLIADEWQLERVVANLLANAIKYTPSGGRITVSSGRETGRVAVAFRDTGRGIPPEELPHLFEKYRRVREAKRTEGTGLGLFIAKTIVDAHRGDIRVESTPGVGSTFTVLLPG